MFVLFSHVNVTFNQMSTLCFDIGYHKHHFWETSFFFWFILVHVHLRSKKPSFNLKAGILTCIIYYNHLFILYFYFVLIVHLLLLGFNSFITWVIFIISPNDFHSLPLLKYNSDLFYTLHLTYSWAGWKWIMMEILNGFLRVGNIVIFIISLL